MDAQIIPAKAGKLNSVITVLKRDFVLTTSLILALASCFAAQPNIRYIDFKVLVCLFNLMLVVKAFEELQLLDKFAVDILNRCTDSRKVSLLLIVLCFFTSMFITNDIALITLVPLTLIIGRKSNINVITTIILQTMAANIGSSLTPMGNPQNLYIYSYYKLTSAQFFAPVALFAGLGLVWLYILNYGNHNMKLDIALDKIKILDKTKAVIWGVLFIIVILSVFGVINYLAALFTTLMVTLLVNRKLIYKIDYLLLITFVCFFIFIGNISSIHMINSYMRESINTGSATYFKSIALSQIISNVPCSIFLSRFTSHWKELLAGVNIGGMGTIIASLASVISYKLFIEENPDKSKTYIIKFTIYNFISLVLFSLINYFLVVSR